MGETPANRLDVFEPPSKFLLHEHKRNEKEGYEGYVISSSLDEQEKEGRKREDV